MVTAKLLVVLFE